MTTFAYTDDQMKLIHQLEELRGYAGREADDEFRDLIAEIQDEFNNMKRAAAREIEGVDPRLKVGDITGFATGLKDEFPVAAEGCLTFAAIWVEEQRIAAPSN